MITYPAIFHIAEEGGYWVSFPDIDGCFSDGESLDDALHNAQIALSLYFEDFSSTIQTFPPASSLDAITVDDGIVKLVSCDVGLLNKN